MSWQANQAVRKSKMTDPTGRCILFSIATYCNDAGNMDGITYPPSYETIANGAGCHKQTVKNWIPKLVEFGELSIRKEGGGRGTKVFFTINLSMGNPDTDNERLSLQERTVQALVPLNGNVEETVQELKLMVQELTLTVQGMVYNGTPRDIPMKKDEEEKNKEKSKTPLAPQSGGNGAVAINSMDEICSHFQKLAFLKGKTWTTAKWYQPMVSIYEACDSDFEKTKGVIKSAIDDMRHRGLSIASPSSIQAVAIGIAQKKNGVPAKLNGQVPAQVTNLAGYKIPDPNLFLKGD